jgi:hypothetical protein
MTIAYCTIVAQNYLPQAVSLFQSVKAHEPKRDMYVLVVDGQRSDLEVKYPGLRVLSSADLGLPAREFDDLATIYDVVELSTAIKPLLLKRLLETYEQAAYLDPDMFVVTPLTELPNLLDQYGIVLTPHFLEAIPPGSAYITEVHSLTVGVHNLGFCAVDRSAIGFLDWWWSHLRRECLIYPLLGIFVDQKWTDVGANLFGAHSLRHAGYNVGPWNLLERAITQEDGGYLVGVQHDELRLLHFSGFDPTKPDAISVRLNFDMTGEGSPAFVDLSREYAAVVLRSQGEIGCPPDYAFSIDSSGRPINKRLRRTYRVALLADDDGQLPSAFDPHDARAFAAWRRKSVPSRIALTLGDAAIAAKYALPDEYGWFKRTLPGSFGRLRSRLLGAGRVRR